MFMLLLAGLQCKDTGRFEGEMTGFEGEMSLFLFPISNQC